MIRAAFALVAAAGAIATAPPQVDLSRARGPQNEASIAVDPANHRVLLAASQDVDHCGIRVYGSTDGGRSWQSQLLSVPNAAAVRRARGPGRFCAANQWVAIDSSGGEHVAFVAAELLQGRVIYRTVVASRPGPSGRFTIARVDAPTGPTSDDKPMLVADPRRERLYVAWTREDFAVSRAFHNQPVVVARSDDGGRTWSRPTRVGTIGGWGVHLAVGSDGALYAAWWTGTEDVVARSADGGAHFEPQRRLASLLDVRGFPDAYGIPAAPAEPVHPDPSLDVDRSGRFGGRVYALYTWVTARGRRAFLVALAPDLRPLSTRVVAPVAGVRDEFDATVAVDQARGAVWACFYLTGAGPARALATYSCTSSRDGGSHWTLVRSVASRPSDETQPGGFHRVSGEYASYDGLAAADGVAFPIWTDTRRLRALGEEIYATRVGG